MRAAVFLLLAAAGASAEQFTRKECLDCHQLFAKKLKTLPVKHPGSCEDCHLRHGIVPKLLLKETGSGLCLSCHQKEKLGFDKPVVHKALKSSECITCHDPHGSKQPKLLKAEGAQACFACHKQEPFRKKVVHKV